jgi:chaperone protein EcpD
MLKKIPYCFILIASFFISASVLADVAINGTRIVFNAKDKESVVQLKNNGKNPYLLQLWIDDGNSKSRPGEVKVPFVGNDSNLLIVFYVQIMPDDLVMQLHRF